MTLSSLRELEVLPCQLHVQPKGERKYRVVDIVSPVPVPGGIGPFTATFHVASGCPESALTLRWPVPDDHRMKKETFLNLCYSQAEYFNAQLLKLGGQYRVTAFDQTYQVAEDRFDTNRYTIPFSPFELVAVVGNPRISPYNATVEPIK